MSQIEKLLIPLIDDNIKTNEVNTEKFIGVFTDDINSPGLDYVYLVFIYDIKNLHKDLSINGIDCVRNINDQLYQIYKFPKVSVDLKRLLKGDYNLISNEGVSKIYNFWKGVDDSTANYPFYRVLSKERYSRTISEEKFVSVRKRKEPQGITVKKQ